MVSLLIMIPLPLLMFFDLVMEYELSIKDEYVNYKPIKIECSNTNQNLHKSLGFTTDQLPKFFDNCQKFLDG